jgi:uncharacterized protein YegL
METNGKIGILNRAIAEMIRSFADEDVSTAEIQVAVITFGGDRAQLHQDLKPAAEITWVDMQAKGKTPLGAAFETAVDLINDRQRIPNRAYRPTLILVSDGIPTDDWQPSLQQLLESERASKAARFALAVGEDANRELLNRFGKVFEALDASHIVDRFEFITMSVTARSRSDQPNNIQVTEGDDVDY